MKRLFAHHRPFLSLFAALILASLPLAGCGKTAFVVTSSSDTQVAPGSFLIPSKVDILLAEADNGARFEDYDAINGQLKDFLTSLQAKNWDYHFTSIPLTTDRAITQVTAGTYDGNWGSQWTAPYPGARPGGTDTVAASVFKFPSQFNFIDRSQVSNAQNGVENGFETIRLALESRAGGTGFLRPDALLVIAVISNGDDTSGIQYCDRGDGVVQPCDASQPAAMADYYRNRFVALKNGSQGSVQFHAVVANQLSRSNECLNSNTRRGARYQQMAASLGGQSYDLCTTATATILAQLENNLQGTRLAMRTRYLFMNSEPDPASISVTKYINGSANNAIAIPQDANNGWTYVGNVSNVYIVDYPVPSNLGSGWAIELHGAAKLLGDDTAKVDFKHAGSQNSYN